VPQPGHELSDMQDRSIEGQFYSYELVNVTVSLRTGFQIDKIVRTRNNNGTNSISSSGEDTTKRLILG
jgi:hypothetical protein